MKEPDVSVVDGGSLDIRTDGAAPIVSVLMATYNQAGTLGAAIESILNQSMEQFEFVIVDDCSTDNTQDVLQRFHDPRIRRVRNPQNLGLAASLNRGLEIARGQYIARMDSDDLSARDRLEKQLDYLLRHPDVGVLGTQYADCRNGGKRQVASEAPLTHGLILWEYLTRLAYPLTHATIMIRRDVIQEAGGYNEDYRREQDGELFLRLAFRTRLENLGEVLYFVRNERTKSASVDIFVQGYPATIGIRQAALERLLGREVAGDIVRAVIFPTSRHHRGILGLSPEQNTVRLALRLILDVFEALDCQGLFTAAERERALNEIPELMMNIAGWSEDVVFQAVDHFPMWKSIKYVMQRLNTHLKRACSLTSER